MTLRYKKIETHLKTKFGILLNHFFLNHDLVVGEFN